ncbi:hypothetical protein [Geoalkalibacter subterraneus]|nr:hypothetical protein [Geoalkalibacter subterraneus]
MVRKTVVDNGIRIISEQMVAAHSATICVSVRRVFRRTILIVFRPI